MRSDEKQMVGCRHVRDRILLGFVLLSVAAAEAQAEEHYSSVVLDAAANSARPLRASQIAPSGIPGNGSFSAAAFTAGTVSGDLFTAPAMLAAPRFSATDFSPRKHTVFDVDPAVAAYSDTPMLRGTTIWQRMNDYRSRDRVRLLTLWESSGSILSLQAGKRGDPSLQWTSTAMNRGGATRGLLDKLFSVSIAGVGETLGKVGHSKSSSLKPGSQPNIAELK
jgi:hypothetical protein